MPVNLVDLEAAIRAAFPVTHLEIEDQSSGCGENYAIVVVSEVSALPAHQLILELIYVLGGAQAFTGKTTLARHRLSE